MEYGKIVFLNGVSSTGKTTISREIQGVSSDFYYVLSNDHFRGLVGEKHLIHNYWKHYSKVIMMMYYTARMLSSKGNNVIIDGMLEERPGLTPHYNNLIEILKGYPLYIIELVCPLDECKKRNIKRGDRGLEQSEEQHKVMAKGISYFYAVDTSKNRSRECAMKIINELSKV